MFFEDIQQEALDWRARGLERFRRVIDSAQGPVVTFEGRRYLSFLSNDYLGLAGDPRLSQALALGAQTHGAGAGASPLISGHLACHHRAEQALAEFVGAERALLFITGYVANIAILTSFAGEDSVVFSDALNHASLIDGCRLSRATIARYDHNSLISLEKILSKAASPRKIIVTDAVFSMDGDVAPLEELLDLAERYDALLVVDDAHGFGVRGPKGQGSWAETGLQSPRVLQMVTLGKAAGLSGAAALGDARLIEHLIQHARTYIYSTSPLPALAAAIPASLALIAEESWRREHLMAHQAMVRKGLASLGVEVDATTPIVPIPVGDAREAMAWAERLIERGVLVAGIRPPTVPEGGSRLRISLSAAHTTEDIDTLLRALKETRP